jgi:hypothetical protein
VKGLVKKISWLILNSQDMKKELNISAVLDKPELLEDLVERLADRKYDIGYGKEEMPVNLEALETSSAETYVSGIISFTDKNEKINMPFITSFLFTCTKANNDPYKLTWSTSLS